MTEAKREARSSVAAPERAKREKRLPSGISHRYSNPAQDNSPVTVSQYLQHGQENATPLRQLKKLLGADGRTVRLMIQRERLAGVPILSDNSTGYFLPGDKGERERFVRSMRHRAGEIMKTARAIERGAGLD